MRKLATVYSVLGALGWRFAVWMDRKLSRTPTVPRDSSRFWRITQPIGTVIFVGLLAFLFGAAFHLWGE